MQIDKSEILELLRSEGNHGKAQQVDAELPDAIDTEQHADQLQKLGLDPQALIGKLAGGGLGGLLGK